MQRRVVVSGLGLVTPLATGVSHTWNRLIQGHSGITSINTDLPSKVAGVVSRGEKEHEFNVDEWIEKKDQRHSSPFIQFAFSAAEQAIRDSKLTDREKYQYRTGVYISSGVGNIDGIISTTKDFTSNGYHKVSPYFIPGVLINMAAGKIALKYGFKGPNQACSTACAAGAHAIGDSYHIIKRGDADIMIAGGSEACINDIVISGFSRMRALSTKHNETPELASRPFSPDCDGFVIAEGAGIVVLEEYTHAIQRGAPIYAEILGYGSSCDAHHIAAPAPDGDGAFRAMQAALKNANLSPDQVDYVNAHATSTPLGDAAELNAINRLFGEKKNPILVSSTKGAIGHLLGAAGAVEAIFSILAIHRNCVPPSLNAQKQNIKSVDIITENGRQHSVSVAMSNSFGFGGTNTSLVFGR
eukprot:TRINITY_DN9433_c0_g1_i1.p1 TRINITY_DN9433_c0_g1~~TRINITY_DN9433_c0_g1_i1.p1  ORF type:complete len:413 (+),score=84.70 TRINITY_DN9433_c0_g1_i1:24-1262(+)